MKYLLGIDLGTSSVKAILMDIEGNIISTANEEYSISIPQVGCAEQSPEDWWKATKKTIVKVISISTIDSKNIQGIGFSGQMHGLVPLDRGGNVIRPAIIWADQRTRDIVSRVNNNIGRDRIAKFTLNSLATGFYIVSLMWIKENEPNKYNRIYKAILPKDYIRYRLIGKLGTDTTDASSTLAFDTAKRSWAFELIKDFEINPEIFPECHEPWEVAGELNNNIVSELGLNSGTPVVFGGGDQLMQSLGNGIIKPGIISSNIGTASQVSSLVKEPVFDMLLRTNTFCHALPDAWNIMGASLNGGLALKWLRDSVLERTSYDEISDMAQRVKAGSEGLIFLPYLVGERTPHLDPDARGVFFGLNLKHNKSHFARSVMEGVVYSLKDSLEILKSLNIKDDKIIASGGGAKSKAWLQIQADVFNREIYVTNSSEQACIGAAIMAGVGTGVYKSIEEACGTIVKFKDEVVLPIEENVKKYEHHYQIYKDLYIKNKEIFPVLNQI